MTNPANPWPLLKRIKKNKICLESDQALTVRPYVAQPAAIGHKCASQTTPKKK